MSPRLGEGQAVSTTGEQHQKRPGSLDLEKQKHKHKLETQMSCTKLEGMAVCKRDSSIWSFRKAITMRQKLTEAQEQAVPLVAIMDGPVSASPRVCTLHF